MLAPDQIDAMPSQPESRLDDDADYQIAYQSARPVAVNGYRRWSARVFASARRAGGFEKGEHGHDPAIHLLFFDDA
jgi:hypothetical protein